MSTERYLLESAIQTLRGKIAETRNTHESFRMLPYYGGRTDLAWRCNGMEHALSILESMAYEFIQMEIETSQP